MQKQYQNDWIHPSGRSPHLIAHAWWQPCLSLLWGSSSCAQPFALYISHQALVGTCCGLGCKVPVEQGGQPAPASGGGTHESMLPAPQDCDLLHKQAKASCGQSKNYPGIPRGDSGTVSAVPSRMVMWGEKIKGHTTSVGGRNYDYFADRLALTAPELAGNLCQNNLTITVLLPLALTQNYTVTEMMKNYPVNCFNFKT